MLIFEFTDQLQTQSKERKAGGRKKGADEFLREQTLVLIGSDLQSYDEILASKNGGRKQQHSAAGPGVSLGAVEEGEVRQRQQQPRGKPRQWCGLGYVSRGERGFAMREGAGVLILPSTWHNAGSGHEEVWVLPLDSLVSGMREYFALRHLRHSKMLPAVLGGSCNQGQGSTTDSSMPAAAELALTGGAPRNVRNSVGSKPFLGAKSTGRSSPAARADLGLGLPSKFMDYVHGNFNTAQRAAIADAAAPDATGESIIWI